MSMKYFFGIVLFGGIFFLISQQVEPMLIGTAPTESFQPGQMAGGVRHQSQGEGAAYNDPEISRLRDVTKTRPEDPRVWISLADGVLGKVSSGILPKQAVFEALEALETAQSVDPNNPEVIIRVADLSFEYQALSKAKEYYEKYLAIRKDDHEVEARYASALTVMGEAKKATEILLRLTKAHPENFKYHAFLALSLGEQGDKEQLQQVASRALELAPTDEARKRLEGFIAQVTSEEYVSSPEDVLPPDSLKVYLQKNPVLGPKIESFDEDGEILIVNVKNFPMAQMPPFAKEKFFSGIREYIANNSDDGRVQEVRFRDLESGEIMEALSLAE